MKMLLPKCECGCGEEVRLHNGRPQRFLHNHFWNWKRSNDPSFGAIMREKRPTYNVWYGIVKRCTKPTCRHFNYYGGRGIKVCDRWLSFDNFFQDMGPRPDGLQIDRIDNNGDYEPGNCRWVDRKTQARNTRRTRLITFAGETRCLREWEPLLGLPMNTLRMRLKRHPFESVFSNYHSNNV